MTLGHFILGTYGILTMFAGLFIAKGVPLLQSLAIFVFPTVVLAEYFWLAWRREKNPAYQRGLDSQEILKMVQSNDAPGKPFYEVMDTLEETLGGGLHCDMSGYMEGAVQNG